MYAWVVQLQVQLAGATVSFSGAGGDGRRDVVVVGCWTRLPLAPGEAGRKLGDRRMGHPVAARLPKILCSRLLFDTHQSTYTLIELIRT